MVLRVVRGQVARAIRVEVEGSAQGSHCSGIEIFKKFLMTGVN